MIDSINSIMDRHHTDSTLYIIDSIYKVDKRQDTPRHLSCRALSWQPRPAETRKIREDHGGWLFGENGELFPRKIVIYLVHIYISYFNEFKWLYGLKPMATVVHIFHI